MRLFRLLVLLTLACQSIPAPAAPDSAPDAPIVGTERFELRSNIRVNLHHFLLAWTAADGDTWPPYALPVAERGYWRLLLNDEEARTWSAATAAYAATLDRDLLFDEGLLALRDWSAGIATRDSIPAADQPLADALEAALVIYTRHWWPPTSETACPRAWNSFFTRHRWAAQLPALQKYWKPFLDSGSADAGARKAALQTLAEQVLAAEPAANSARSSSTNERRLPATPR